MRDSTVVWAGYTVVGDADFVPVVVSGPIGTCLLNLVQFVERYQMVKGFVFTVARKESEVHHRLAKHQEAKVATIKGESIHSLIARLAMPAAMSDDDEASEGKDLPTNQPDQSESLDIDAILDAALKKDS